MVETDFSSIHKIKWYQEKQEVDVQTAFDESVRLYREQLLQVLQESDVQVRGEKIRIVGGGIGGVIDGLALMQVTGASEVEVIDVGEEVFKPAMSLKGLIAHQYPQLTDQLNHISFATADITKLSGAHPVPLSVFRSIETKHGANILAGMVRTTRPGGILMATILDNPAGEKYFTAEQQDIRNAFDQLTKAGRVHVVTDKRLRHPIQGGGLFRGEAHVFTAQVR